VKPHHLFIALAAFGITAMSHAAVSPVLVIHGGAGVIKRDMTPAKEQAVRAAMTQALQDGYAQLKAGKSALDAVAAAITVLEDDPNFNAGKGAVFTHEGKNELDAAIMDGNTLRAGAVAGVQRVKNPILLARAVMEHSPHVMLSGDGAEAFAKEQGITLVDPSYFRTEGRWQQLQKALKEDAAKQPHADVETAKHFGTVGAVALDAEGHISIPFNTDGMYRGWIGADGVPHVAIYGDEDDGTAELPAPAPADSVAQP
jgi:beta-aspartyl-peptidase (threonine type)